MDTKQGIHQLDPNYDGDDNNNVGANKKRSIQNDEYKERNTESEVKKPRAQDTKIDDKKEKVNYYNGWVIPQKDYTIPSISVKDLSPEKFYEEYVSQRKPTILQGGLEDLDGLKKWIDNNDHLRKCAGKENVMVEVRSNENDSFGRGNEVAMTFNKFLDLIEKGDAMHYLTTQDVEANEDGQPDLMAPFMKALKEDFPLRPKIMGNLIPQNLNLWFGNNKDGASSGLHHDYHDNLYILLRGKKKFRLYSPEDTEKMYSRGKLLRVYPNGRINYEGEETTAYGADLLADTAAKASKAKEEAEQKLLEAEQKVKDGVPGAEEELEFAEEMLDKAMDALIDIEMDGDDDDDNIEDKLENFGESEDESGVFGDDSDNNDNSETEEASKYCLVDKTVKDPNNFSLISPHTLLREAELLEKYPRMRDTKPAFCELVEGDMLYLPASFWHEVTSFGAGSNGHLAMNFWFHPPDIVDNFKQPYSTDFWPNDYKLRCSK